MEGELLVSVMYQASLVAGAFAGALRSFLGWLDSGDDFDWRLFTATSIRTVILGAMYGFNANLDPVSTFFYVFATDKLLSTGYSIGGKKK